VIVISALEAADYMSFPSARHMPGYHPIWSGMYVARPADNGR